MKLKKSSYYCLSQATPPLKNWLHSNKLRYLVLAASVFPMLGTQLYATTDNSLNQTTQSAQTNKVTYHGTVIDENGNPLPGVNITYKMQKVWASLQMLTVISPLQFLQMYTLLFFPM